MENYLIMLKRNISSLMENHKPEVTQEELGKVTGLSQPNISKLLSEKNESCFSIAQLISIADYFEVSLDSLVGRNLDNVKQKKSTMQDIISALFELEMVDFKINIKQEEIEEYNPISEKLFTNEIISHNISFTLKYLDDFLSEWKSARTMTIDNKSVSKVAKDMYESWKKEKLNEAANISLDGSPYYDYLDFNIPDGAELPFD